MQDDYSGNFTVTDLPDFLATRTIDKQSSTARFSRTDPPGWLFDEQLALRTVGSHIGIWRWDFETDALEWSDGLLAIVGLDRAAFGGTAQAAYALVHPDDRSFRAIALESHLRHGKPYRYVYRMRHADGYYKQCRTEGMIVRGAQGDAIGMAGITLDISEEADVMQKLRDSERRLGTLAAGFDGAIFRYHQHADGTDAVSYMSEGAERVWGLEPDEVIGDPGKIWATVHPDDVDLVRDGFAEANRALTKLNLRWRVLPGNGDIRWIECRATPRRTDRDETIWDGFVIDISEMMAARDELQRTTEMLGQAQKHEAIGQISGGIAHDFNNLLAVILGNAELIDPSGLDADDLSSVSAITASCHKGADLTRRLLSFARKSQLDPRRVSFRRIVTDMLPLIRRTLPADIEIVWDGEAAPPAVVDVDVVMLESSILNILLNARDAMTSGGAVVITLSERRQPGKRRTSDGAPVHPGPYASLAIADTGAGIPAHLVGRVTDPFVTTKGPELGSGLGLAMVDGFVAQSGGFLDIESSEGQGTVITLNIPKADASTVPLHGEEPETSNPQGLADPRAVGRALLVEDEEQVRIVTARILRRMGLEVDAVETAIEAMELLQREGNAYDVMLTDVVMPGTMSGPQLATAARRVFPDLPIVLMTGYGPDQILRDSEISQFGVLLRKPVDRKALEEAVLRVMSLTR